MVPDAGTCVVVGLQEENHLEKTDSLRGLSINLAGMFAPLQFHPLAVVRIMLITNPYSLKR